MACLAPWLSVIGNTGVGCILCFSRRPTGCVISTPSADSQLFVKLDAFFSASCCWHGLQNAAAPRVPEVVLTAPWFMPSLITVVNPELLVEAESFSLGS